ncbi:DNA polymerase epsilon subunit 4-like [Passer montanus]|nr:DNA polymerase epsilon subunit 4-like [Passer montanus]
MGCRAAAGRPHGQRTLGHSTGRQQGRPPRTSPTSLSAERAAREPRWGTEGICGEQRDGAEGAVLGDAVKARMRGRVRRWAEGEAEACRREEGPGWGRQPGRDAARPRRARPGPQGPGAARLARLPLARVKALVKADPDVTLASQEAVFVLARATELFVETIAKDAYVYAQQGKRKTLQRKDLDNAIEAIDEFAFLEGTLD